MEPKGSPRAYDDGASPGLCVELRGQGSLRPELNGIYVQSTKEMWSGEPVFRKRGTSLCMVWQPGPPRRWRVVPHFGSTETLAYADADSLRNGPAPMPCQVVERTWIVVQLPPGSGILGLGTPREAAIETPEPNLECIFVGQTLIVSGRSGHNQRLNGVFSELLDRFGGFPAYFDAQKQMYLYRRKEPAAWVIGNRLGAGLRGEERRGRGVVFAENDEDVLRPYLATQAWTVGSWGSHVAEVDPNISVYICADADGSASAKAPPAAALLAVRSRSRPELAGSYVLRKHEVVNGHPVYVRSADDVAEQKCLFWDGERWCIGSTPGASAQDCDARSQRRVATAGRNRPEDAVWNGVKVLSGDSKERIDASLLSTLKGRISSMSQQFN